MWMEVPVDAALFQRLWSLVGTEAKQIYDGSLRTIHLWPQVPMGGDLSKLILIEATVSDPPRADSPPTDSSTGTPGCTPA